MSHKRDPDDIEPGSWGEVSQDDATFRPPTEIEVKERIPAAHADLVKKYTAFTSALSPHIKVVYHPSNATDISPSEVFKDSRVIYVEIDKASVDALQKAGYESHYGSAANEVPGKSDIPIYVPDEPVDVLILLNPAISSTVPAGFVKEGGYALANDYHRNATELKDNPEFELVGIIKGNNGSDEYSLDTDSPEDYWREIETDEEFKKAPFDWGSVDYKTAEDVVKLLTGKTENILQEYKALIQKARADERKDLQGTLEHFEENFQLFLQDLKTYGEEVDALSPEEIESRRTTYRTMLQYNLSEVDTKEDFIVNVTGSTLVISSHLPRKKGVVDDLFVFRKVNSL